MFTIDRNTFIELSDVMTNSAFDACILLTLIIHNRKDVIDSPVYWRVDPLPRPDMPRFHQIV